MGRLGGEGEFVNRYPENAPSLVPRFVIGCHDGAPLTVVTPGLDPGAQGPQRAAVADMDCRVKPGNDKEG
jgi:hypothetical protein